MRLLKPMSAWFRSSTEIATLSSGSPLSRLNSTSSVIRDCQRGTNLWDQDTKVWCAPLNPTSRTTNVRRAIGEAEQFRTCTGLHFHIIAVGINDDYRHVERQMREAVPRAPEYRKVYLDPPRQVKDNVHRQGLNRQTSSQDDYKRHE